MISKQDQVLLQECVMIYHPVYTLSETMLTATVLKHGPHYISNMVWTALYFSQHFIVFFVHCLIWHNSFIEIIQES